MDKKQQGSGSITGTVSNALGALGKKAEQDIDKYLENMPIGVMPPISFDECVKYAKDMKVQHPEISAVILAVESIGATAKNPEHALVKIGFKDSIGRVLADKNGSAALGKSMRVQSIDMKFIDCLKGQNSVIITF